jgi:hypothetical protein
MARKIVWVYLSCTVIFARSTSVAQIAEYVGVLEGGEGTYESFLVRVDWNASRMVDTVWVVSTLLNDLPLEPPTVGKEILALFTAKDRRPFRLESFRVVRDSIEFATGKHLEFNGAWEKYSFVGRMKARIIVGRMQSKWFPGDGDRVYQDSKKIRFVPAQ